MSTNDLSTYITGVSTKDLVHGEGKHMYAPEEETYGVQWSWIAANSYEEAEAKYLRSCACWIKLSASPSAKKMYSSVLRLRRFPVKRICC